MRPLSPYMEGAEWKLLGAKMHLSLKTMHAARQTCKGHSEDYPNAENATSVESQQVL